MHWSKQIMLSHWEYKSEMCSLRKLAFFHNILFFCSASSIHRAIFEELPNGNSTVKQEGTITNLFHKRFHQCSIDDECNYVVQDINTDEYKKVGRQSQLPINQNGCKIWKKLAIEAPKDGQDASEWYLFLSLRVDALLSSKLGFWIIPTWKSGDRNFYWHLPGKIYATGKTTCENEPGMRFDHRSSVSAKQWLGK